MSDEMVKALIQAINELNRTVDRQNNILVEKLDEVITALDGINSGVN